MNILDKVLLFHLAIQIVFAIFYLKWQFTEMEVPSRVMQSIISVLNLFETVLLILTRFMPFSKWGVFALGAWYVLELIILLMQFVLAKWGWQYKLLDIFWISLYIILFSHDVFHINLIHQFFAKFGPTLMSFGETINGTFWGDVLKSIILFVVKIVFKAIATVYSKDYS